MNVLCLFWLEWCTYFGNYHSPDSSTLMENVKSCKRNVQDVLCILSQIFFARSVKPVELCWNSKAGLWIQSFSVHFQHCNIYLHFLFLSLSLQLLTWGVIVVRSRTFWTRAFRSAHSVSSSQPITASSFCVASGTRVSGSTPLTQVLYIQ